MPYSIGDNQLQVIRGDTNAALSAMGPAYNMMSKGLDKMAATPFLGSELMQDNADARYNAALNRYSNDPEGLARALQNGEIDTTNVRANTLGQTQSKLKDISASKATNYLQNRIEKTNDWQAGNQDLISRYQTAVQTGDKASAASILAEAQKRGITAEAFDRWFVGNPYDQINKDTGFDLQRRQIAQQGAGLALQKQMYENALAKAQYEAELPMALIQAGYTTNEGAINFTPADSAMLGTTPDGQLTPAQLHVKKLLGLNTKYGNEPMSLVQKVINAGYGSADAATPPVVGAKHPLNGQTPTALQDAGSAFTKYKNTGKVSLFNYSGQGF